MRPKGGRREKHPRQRIVDAILYVVRTGCAWRQLPNVLAPWPTVYWYFTWWHDDGAVERIHGVLRCAARSVKPRPRRGAGRRADRLAVRPHRRHGPCCHQGLRRGQGRERPQSIHRHRHPRPSPGRPRRLCKNPGPRRRETAPAMDQARSPRRHEDLGRPGLRRPPRAVGRRDPQP